MDQEPKPPKTTEKALIEALNQNWIHIRHVETERLQFTYLYAGLVGGILAFLGNFGFDDHFYLIIFLIILSTFGLILTFKVSLEFDNHMQKINNIIPKLSLEDYMGTPTSYEGIGKIIRVRNVFIMFYLIMLLTWLILVTKIMS